MNVDLLQQIKNKKIKSEQTCRMDFSSFWVGISGHFISQWWSTSAPRNHVPQPYSIHAVLYFWASNILLNQVEGVELPILLCTPSSSVQTGCCNLCLPVAIFVWPWSLLYPEVNPHQPPTEEMFQWGRKTGRLFQTGKIPQDQGQL